MPAYALVRFPNVDTSGINVLRDEYDLSVQSVARLDESRYNEGVGKAEQARLDFETTLDRLTLVRIDDAFTKTSIVREYRL